MEKAPKKYPSLKEVAPVTLGYSHFCLGLFSLVFFLHDFQKWFTCLKGPKAEMPVNASKKRKVGTAQQIKQINDTQLFL